MRVASPFVLLIACGEPVPEAAPAPIPAPASIVPEDLPPALDAIRLDCDGDDWSVSAEIAGRAAGARAVVVRTEGAPPLAWDLTLTPEPVEAGALWQRFSATVSDPALPCDRAGVALVIEATGPGDAPIGCASVGDHAADLVAGTLDERLGAVPRGRWQGCRVPGPAGAAPVGGPLPGR